MHWRGQDKKTLKRVNQLIKDIDRNGRHGLGKPDPLKHDRQGHWSRRIDDFNRLIHRLENDRIEIAQCRSHYDD
ncbi:MAG: Txe/YoeB family addiction module toxin [Deltaproteobacteria bacterium]|nr:Txe/YoeB family addiction module toxin [Deltaproteobacteria bacterium]